MVRRAAATKLDARSVLRPLRRRLHPPQPCRLPACRLDRRNPRKRAAAVTRDRWPPVPPTRARACRYASFPLDSGRTRSEEHTSELQSLTNLVCRLLLEKKKKNKTNQHHD